ncbi:hypothetical protein ACVWWR_008088 [Bradyrhizobium sp. LM3.2]
MVASAPAASRAVKTTRSSYLIVVIELQLVILLFFIVLVSFEIRLGSGGELVVELGRVFRGKLLVVGRERLGCHETNRC